MQLSNGTYKETLWTFYEICVTYWFAVSTGITYIVSTTIVLRLIQLSSSSNILSQAILTKFLD